MFLKNVVFLLRSICIYTKVLYKRDERREVADNFSPNNYLNFLFFDPVERFIPLFLSLCQIRKSMNIFSMDLLWYIRQIGKWGRPTNFWIRSNNLVKKIWITDEYPNLILHFINSLNQEIQHQERII